MDPYLSSPQEQAVTKTKRIDSSIQLIRTLHVLRASFDVVQM